MSRSPRVVEVKRTQQLGPHMVRVVFGGQDLRDFEARTFTDHYVKIQFPARHAAYRAPFDLQDVKERFPKAQWPRTRTYTVRRFDEAARELTIDFVTHGETGVAGPWAQRAKPGDRLQLLGPGGAYAPRPDADWHLLVGDASAIPAIGAALDRLPDTATALVVIGADEQPLPTTGPGVETRWVAPGRLVDEVAALEFPDGVPHVFLHGEASDVRAIRRHLLADRGVPREGQSISGYWKRDRTEEGWRDDKAEWNRLVERDDRAAA